MIILGKYVTHVEIYVMLFLNHPVTPEYAPEYAPEYVQK